MNAEQKAKVRALARCRLGHFNGAPRFVRGLLWLREHAPDTELTWRQKWFLDWLIYRFRKQLAGREFGYTMPTAEPQQDDYCPDRKPAPQPNLFGELQDVASPPPKPTESVPTPPRQARLL